MTTLLGPNGRPMADYVQTDVKNFKKAPPPKLGPAFGDWAGRDNLLNQMPGAAVLQFDLNKLTLADFRAMKDHPQINASLAVLAFMMHGLDWWIECDDKKIAEFIETNLKQVWTRFIRAASQSYWAGYSPIVIEFENDPGSGRIVINKFKDLMPEECRVNWKEVEGWAPPNASVRPKFKIYDGIVQTGRSFPIPVDNCVHPDTPVLCADYEWRSAGSLNVGQKIIAFDESDAGEADGRGGRKYRIAEIVVNNAGRKPCVEIRCDRGEPIVASIDHPFLVRVPATKPGNRRDPATGRMMKAEGVVHYADHWAWVEARDLKPGSLVGWFGDPAAWEHDDSREAGWVAGMFDGEGCVSGHQLTISQNEGIVLQQLKDILARKGFDFTATTNDRDHCVQLSLRGGVREIARFLNVFRPVRLCEKFPQLLDGVWLKINKSIDLTIIESVEDVGEQPIASIQTSCGTFITGGFTSHNTVWYPVLMENGNYYGRKLLRPAFASWYFSILIHLFANRYFERFGEPLAVGRAPFDDDITTRDSQGNAKTVTGKEAMENILLNLRNRSVVVLPNDIIPGSRIAGDKTAFEYSIEYLESQLRGVDFERYLGRLDEEMSLGIFTPVLLFRTADVGSYNLGVGHMQLFMWMLNALAGDLKEYIDNYVVKRLKDINFGPNSPRAEFKFRPMGKENTETVRAVLTELVRGGGVRPNLDELGMIAGLTLEEVEIVVDGPDDPDAPDDDKRTGRTRPKSGGPRGVGQPRATGRQISNRIRSQVENAWANKTFGTAYHPSLGFRRRFEESLKAEGASDEVAKNLADRFFTRVSNWMNDAINLGMEEYTGPDDFMSLLDRLIETEIDSLAGSNA